MKRVVASGLLCLLCAAAAAGLPAAREVLVVVLDGQEGVAGVSVQVDGADVATTAADGTATLTASEGSQQIMLMREGKELAGTRLTLGDGEAAEVIARLRGDGQATIAVDVFRAATPGTGQLSGIVRDGAGNPVAGASVALTGTSVSGTTDAQGLFRLSGTRGTYELVISHPQRGTRSYPRVRVSPNLSAPAEYSLTEQRAAPSGGVVEEVVATARYVPEDTSALERSTASVLDVISTEEIALAGDSDAASALQRVTGVTIVNNLVFVRGLGDRYSATYVNRLDVPSPDPSRRAISLDLFPTDLLGGIEVQKTYTPDLPGDFSGGAVLLRTASVPSGFGGHVAAKTGGNSRTTGENFLTYNGGDRDRWGMDDGAREIPGLAASLTQDGRRPLTELSDAEREAVAESLPVVYDVRPRDAAPDSGFDLGVGGRYEGFEFATLGYRAALLYDRKQRFREEERAEFRPESGTVGLFERERLERSEESVETGGIVSLMAQINKDNLVELNSLTSRQTTKGTFYSEAYEVDSDRDFRRFTLDWIENELVSRQLHGTHKTPYLGDLGITWFAGKAKASSEILDRREYTYNRPAGAAPDVPFALSVGASGTGARPSRSWEFLDDQTTDLGLDFSLPFEASQAFGGSLKFGLRSTEREREYDIVRWAFNLPNRSGDAGEAITRPSVEQILIPEFIGGGSDQREFVLINSSSLVAGANADNYLAGQDTSAHYLFGDLFFGEKWRAQVGARREDSTIEVGLLGTTAGAASLENADTLPALNLTYNLDADRQLRFGASKTVNRPQFRELAEVAYRDPETRRLTIGNSALVQAEIKNYDFRYERYFNATEGYTVALFYKDFTNPIEATVRPESGGRGVRSFANVDGATVYGLEFDFRVDFDEFGDATRFFGHTYLASNLSLIESEVTLNPEQQQLLTNSSRELQGQSPWIANLTFGYRNPVNDLDMTLLLNMFGERITEVGFNGLPDAVEEPYPLLDFNLRKVVLADWKLGFKLRNLLDPEIRVDQGGETQRAYRLGRSLSLSLEYSF